MNLQAINAHAGKIGQAIHRIQEVKRILQALNSENSSLKISVSETPNFIAVDLTAIKDSEVECEIFCSLISEYNQRLRNYESALKELVIRSAETLLEPAQDTDEVRS